jgi:hypothetical protein
MTDADIWKAAGTFAAIAVAFIVAIRLMLDRAGRD